MNATHSQLQRTSNPALNQIVEPLANYICAADRPRETLLSALSLLFDEVQGTHRATLAHITAHHVDSLGLAS
jgi:hypothetical protein